jgi:hypothetical protein
MKRRLAFLLATISLPITLRAQQTVTATPAGTPAPPRSDSACTYQACAFTIAPRWDGLAVKRGTGGPIVTKLHFFWPIDITSALRGSDSAAVGADSAAAHAWRAVNLRRVGAGFTDLGLVVTTVTVLRSLAQGRFAERDQVLAGAAVGAFAVSVPLHFAADGELSRAVWWHNLRFGR